MHYNGKNQIKLSLRKYFRKGKRLSNGMGAVSFMIYSLPPFPF